MVALVRSMSVMALSLARYLLYAFLTLPLEKSGANIAGRCILTSSCIYYLSAKLYALSDALTRCAGFCRSRRLPGRRESPSRGGMAASESTVG
jgi:hypothetical protein